MRRSAEDGDQPVPIQPRDDAYGGNATQENLEQHAPCARVKIGLDRALKRDKRNRHQQRNSIHDSSMVWRNRHACQHC